MNYELVVASIRTEHPHCGQRIQSLWWTATAGGHCKSPFVETENSVSRLFSLWAFRMGLIHIDRLQSA